MAKEIQLKYVKLAVGIVALILVTFTGVEISTGKVTDFACSVGVITCTVKEADVSE